MNNTQSVPQCNKSSIPSQHAHTRTHARTHTHTRTHTPHTLLSPTTSCSTSSGREGCMRARPLKCSRTAHKDKQCTQQGITDGLTVSAVCVSGHLLSATRSRLSTLSPSFSPPTASRRGLSGQNLAANIAPWTMGREGGREGEVESGQC